MNKNFTAPAWYDNMTRWIEEIEDFETQRDRLYEEIDDDSFCLKRSIQLNTVEEEILYDKINDTAKDYLVEVDTLSMDFMHDWSYEQFVAECDNELDKAYIELEDIRRDWRYDYQNLLGEVDKF